MLLRGEAAQGHMRAVLVIERQFSLRLSKAVSRQASGWLLGLMGGGGRVSDQVTYTCGPLGLGNKSQITLPHMD